MTRHSLDPLNDSIIRLEGCCESCAIVPQKTALGKAHRGGNAKKEKKKTGPVQ